MVLPQSQALEQSQRIQVEMEGQLVKIRVERYDERLGWYTSGAISLPLQQLPLLEQAVDMMRTCASREEPLSAKIIPFPGAMRPSGGR